MIVQDSLLLPSLHFRTGGKGDVHWEAKSSTIVYGDILSLIWR